ncbi:MAG: DNA polymerase III subunit beta [Verrucomicrobiae bacterium]|nr:DNA polymerase III subunit beta [Verrucomicrobiae bacterium]
MKFKITKDNLFNGLAALQGVVGHRTTLPILSNVLVHADAGRLDLTATDLDVTVTRVVPADVPKKGQVTLPARRLFSLVRELGTGDIEFDVDDQCRCNMRVGASFYKIHGLSPEEFPPLPKFKDERKVVLDQSKVLTMLKRTSYAASFDEARYVLNGINFSLRDHKMTMVATDGRRLALAEEEVDLPEGMQADFTIPTKAVNELSRLLGPEGQVEIMSSENYAGFTLRGEGQPPTSLFTKLVDGIYPNYRQVIPSETKIRVQLPREEFLHALRRSEIMTSDKQNSVRLIFANNTLIITANSPEVGEGEERIAVNYQGQPLSIAFNPRFLISPLEALEGEEEIFFDFVDELAPGVIRIKGPFLYVVMPMRLS